MSNIEFETPGRRDGPRRDRTGAHWHLHLGDRRALMTLRPNWIAIATCLFINCPPRCLNLQHLKIRTLNVTFHLALAEPIMALRENVVGVIVLHLQLRSRWKPAR